MKPTPETPDEKRARLLDILINLLNRLMVLGLSVEYKRISGGFTIKILGTDLVPLGDSNTGNKSVK